jgi:antitoxin component YwqK of YwqJK toxin-antitoxin module
MWAEGVLDGLTWAYRVDGTLEQSQMFVKGQLHGPSITYHVDGATVVRSLQFMHGLQVCAAAAAADASSPIPPPSLFQDGTCQWFRNDGSRLSAAEYSYGKLHGVQTWYKADGCSVDYVEKYWNGARMRADIDHVAAGSGSPGGSGGSPGRWTEVEREQVKVT